MLVWKGTMMMEVQSMQGLSPEVQALVRSPESIRKVTELAESCRLDPDMLDRLNQQGGQLREKVFQDFGVDSPEGLEAVFVANSEGVEHFIIPLDPNSALNDEHLAKVTGGSTASTAGTIGSASSFLTFTSLSTAGTAGTAGCAGSAG